MLGSASFDKSSKIIDFKTGKTIFSGITPDESKLLKNALFFDSYGIIKVVPRLHVSSSPLEHKERAKKKYRKKKESSTRLAIIVIKIYLKGMYYFIPTKINTERFYINAL